ncbi:amino acid-binding protein [Methanobrevibacter filiformis]|uniref:ACT domain-containing protein n=1 Tax=Methanobrevibacter filiformis TaxID=55758 RepID=A0A166EZZ5_9EURY|nr:amino acid-binding protein [Methanobrevibacter filiformis]KZX17183.1 hypothetical protein MBFIL_03070 [Methanobrevibacter filiformis]
MWKELSSAFEKYPARLSVAVKMIELGLRVGDDGKIYCGDLKINDASLAKVAEVDRRAIKSTIKSILKDEKLSNIFKNIIPAGTLLKNIAQNIGLGVLEIEVNHKNYGILTEVSKLIYSKKINIRQAYANDTHMNENPVLTIITESPIPGELLKEFLKIEGVTRVSIY